MSSRKLRPRTQKDSDGKISIDISYNSASNANEDPEFDSLQNLFMPEGPQVNEIVFETSELQSTASADPGLNLVPPIPTPSSANECQVSNDNYTDIHSGSVVLVPGINELQAEFREFQRVLLREVEKLKRDIDQILQLLQARNTGDPSYEAVDTPSIPVDSTDALDAFENWLKDPTNSSNLTVYLRRIGGNDLDNFVKRALGRLIGPTLARGMNFTGRNGKVGFQGLAVHSCLNSACRKKPTDTEPTDSQIDLLTKKWFGGSGDRHGGRNERLKKQIQKTSEDK